MCMLFFRMSAQVQRKLEFPVRKPTRSSKKTSQHADSSLCNEKQTRRTRRSTRNNKIQSSDENGHKKKDKFSSPRKRHSSGMAKLIHFKGKHSCTN